MKIFVDLDNTLCRTEQSNYLNSKPIIERIEYFNSLKKQGNTIVIWTARGSRSGIDYQELTKQQLYDWNVSYDTLLMNKPDYDVYYDDKSFNIDSILPIPTSNYISNTNSKKTEAEIVSKGWGREIIFVNNDEYCGKLLCFDKGKKFSMHYHIKKKRNLVC